MKQEHGVHDSGPFYIVREPVQLTDGDDLACLLSQMSAADVQPALIILDTFARCFVGGDENSAMEVGRFIEQARLPERAAAIGRTVAARFASWQERFPAIGDTRGLGAMQALELVKDRVTKEADKERTVRVLKRAYETGLLLVAAGTHGNIVRTLMPLTIADDQLEEGLAVLERALETAL